MEIEIMIEERQGVYQIEAVDFIPKTANEPNIINEQLVTGLEFLNYEKVKQFVFEVVKKNNISVQKEQIRIVAKDSSV